LESVENFFKWKHYESEIILLTVRWYLEYCLSSRDVAERVHQFGPEIDKRNRPFLKPTNNSYRADETYIKVKGIGNIFIEQ
jgi:IS6 family transposase